jgi:hypothetical protein
LPVAEFALFGAIRHRLDETCGSMAEFALTDT